MNNENERPVTVPTEQAAAHEAVKNGSSGFEPQSDVTRDVADSGGDEPQVSNSASNSDQIETKMKEKELKQVSGNGADSHTEENAKVDPPKADKEGEQSASINSCKTTNVKRLELKEGILYHMSEIGIDNISLNYIQSNRREKKQIDDKLKTCEAVGMQVPAVFTDSSIVKDAGYSQASFLTDKESTPDEISFGYTPGEGHNRLWAYFDSLEKERSIPGYKAFDYNFVYKKYPDAKTFCESYRNMNLYNVPTKTSDFANDILATTQLPALIKYKEKIATKLTPKAAGLATVGREIVKRDMKDIFNDKIPSDLQGEEMLVITEPIYNAVMQAFSSEKKAKPIVKGTPIWTYNAKKLNASMDKKAESEKLVKLYSGLGSRECSELMDAKTESGRTKEQIIHQILEKCYSAL